MNKKESAKLARDKRRALKAIRRSVLNQNAKQWVKISSSRLNRQKFNFTLLGILQMKADLGDVRAPVWMLL